MSGEAQIKEINKIASENEYSLHFAVNSKPLIFSFFLTILLLALIWVTSSGKIFPEINISYISIFLLFISFFFSFYALGGVYFFSKQPLDSKDESSNQNRRSLHILYVKLSGLLAIFASYTVWVILIQKEFHPPSSMERDVVIDTFKNMNPLVFLVLMVPVLGSVAFAASLLWTRKYPKEIEPGIIPAPDEEKNKLILIIPMEGQKNGEDHQFKFESKQKISKVNYNNIELHLKYEFDPDWIVGERQNCLRVAMVNKNYGFCIYAKKGDDCFKWKLKVKLESGGEIESDEF